jgi:hypothetical protein
MMTLFIDIAFVDAGGFKSDDRLLEILWTHTLCSFISGSGLIFMSVGFIRNLPNEEKKLSSCDQLFMSKIIIFIFYKPI